MGTNLLEERKSAWMLLVVTRYYGLSMKMFSHLLSLHKTGAQKSQEQGDRIRMRTGGCFHKVPSCNFRVAGRTQIMFKRTLKLENFLVGHYSEAQFEQNVYKIQ